MWRIATIVRGYCDHINNANVKNIIFFFVFENTTNQNFLIVEYYYIACAGKL